MHKQSKQCSPEMERMQPLMDGISSCAVPSPHLSTDRQERQHGLPNGYRVMQDSIAIELLDSPLPPASQQTGGRGSVD